MRQRSSLLVLVLASALMASCSSNGSGGNAGLPDSRQPGAGVHNHVGRATALFVADHASNTVDVYSTQVTGDVAPASTINGPDTQLGSPDGVAVGPDGSIYVANDAGSGSVTVYAPGSSGDAVPVRTMSCGGLAQPAGVSLDAAGDLFVANAGGKSVSVFSPSDSGCVAGNRVIKGLHTCLFEPRDVDIGPDGRIYVASSSAVLVYRPTANGDATPIQKITGSLTQLLPQVWGVSLDSVGDIYVTSWAQNTHGRVTVYAGTATGDAAPTSELKGAATTLDAVRHIELDAFDQAWVSNDAAVDVFATGASGDVAPATTISGAMTGLVNPLGVDIF